MEALNDGSLAQPAASLFVTSAPALDQNVTKASVVLADVPLECRGARRFGKTA